MNNQSQVLESFVKRILTNLDETDPQKLAQFLPLVNPTGCKIIVNSTPFAQPTAFLEVWQSSVVQTQHVLTAVDYHVIPGTGTLICNINGKVRFDESGKDKMGQDAVIRTDNMGAGSAPAAKHRPLWGSYYGVSLQIVIDERIFNNDFNCVVSSFNYTMVYKPEDSLMTL
ncbi:LAFE_0E08614g1_1 [Lachancea fermentati]|uniref:LAFE_0E08614g1_1 n=1 Tax=Lachancea fermentati TaxID=4955 RepID=A0A1G4MDB1_LACFM|nr:LAFE_0E08614g1_1 [Lachancea fermentati]